MKKIVSVFLALCMIVPMLSGFRTVSAADESAVPRRTYYTEEKVKNADDNIGAEYGWALTVRDAAVTAANKYFVKDDSDAIDLDASLERLWKLVTTQELPRASKVSAVLEDTGARSCLYCGAKFGTDRAWQVDPINKQWKVTCSSCKTEFPSNDFGSFYALGLDENGNWDYEQALQKHHEQFACEYVEKYGKCWHFSKPDGGPADWEDRQWAPGDWRSAEWKEYYGYGKGFLKNETTLQGMDNDKKDKAGNTIDENWAVDDGWGYDYLHYMKDEETGEQIYNEDGSEKTENRKKPFIAYYNYHGIWGGPYNYTTGGVIKTALDAFSKAYIYTKDPMYGIAGIILVDRIADVYPKFDCTVHGQRLPISDGSYRVQSGGAMLTGWPTGVILGKLHDTLLATEIVMAYDAFKPALADERVIEFLSEKATEYELAQKTSASAIRSNIEDNFIRKVHEWRCEYKNGNGALTSKYQGNFPEDQLMHILMAVVLDSETETQNWINYEVNHPKKGVLVQLLSRVDRDGHGDETAPAYNGGWVTNFQKLADALEGCDRVSDELKLNTNPKFIKMLTSQIDILCTSDTAPNIGDHNRMGRHITGSNADSVAEILNVLITSYNQIDDTETKKNIARAIYEENGNSFDGIYGNIFETPVNIEAEVRAAVNESQALKLGSRNFTGYGLALLRDGGRILGGENTQRDFYMWYGDTNAGHSHRDKLTLGFHAYGLDVGADMGKYSDAANEANRYEMIRHTMSHNTVTVNDISQLGVDDSKPLHFDAGERVQLIDVAAPEAYAHENVEQYRRTLVMVDADDDISYGVDFFHVKGGEDHLYSFHALGDTATLSDDVSVTSQTDSNGNYIGSYQGVNKPWGGSTVNSIDLTGEGVYNITTGDDEFDTKSWFGKVDKVNDPQKVKMFSMDWLIKDHEEVLSPAKDNLHVRLTMLPSIGLDEIAATSGKYLSPKNDAMKDVRFLFARRTAEKGETLDTLFTSVIEPYDTDRYIKSIENVSVKRDGSDEFVTDEAKAVKVTLTNDRVDYIVYAKDNTVKYIVGEGAASFDFCGFVGVVSMVSGKITYTYLNDGTVIGSSDYIASEYTGTVNGFSKDLTTDNYIDIKLDTPIAPESLKGKYVYINNTGVSADNAVYRIENATSGENGSMRLDIGNTTLIASYKEADEAKGLELAETYGDYYTDTLPPYVYGYDAEEYVYNIAVNNSVSIPLGYEQNVSDRFGSNSGFVRTVNGNGECELTLLAGIDGAEEYNAVGFEITALGVKANSRDKNVYGRVTALNENKENITLLPTQFGENSKYIFSGAFLFGAEYNGYGLMYRPFAIDLNGNWLYGENRVLSRIFGNGEVE